MGKSLDRRPCAANLLISGCMAALCALAALGETSADEKSVSGRSGKMPDVSEIVLPGKYQGHLQDVWWDGGECIYWAHTWDILKTDLTGKILRHVKVEGHNAGCELKNETLYVAVCPTANGRILPWSPKSRLQVNEYDADTLERKAVHIMTANDRAGSFADLKDGSFLVGCLRPGDITDSQVRFHHVSPDFDILSTHLVDNLRVKMGIEVIKRYGDAIYLMSYGGPVVCLDAKTFKETGRLNGINGTRGLIYDGHHCWLGRSQRLPGKPPAGGWTSKLVRVDKKLGE